jgi:hypothetical protein
VKQDKTLVWWPRKPATGPFEAVAPLPGTDGAGPIFQAERPRGGTRGRCSAPCRLGGVVVKPAPALRPFRKAVRRTVPVSVIIAPFPARCKPERSGYAHTFASPSGRLVGRA